MTHLVEILVSQEEFEPFLEVIVLSPIPLAPVVPLDHAYQYRHREGLAEGFIDRPCCCEVVAGRSEHHCAGS
jgi:hypothetical protein